MKLIIDLGGACRIEKYCSRCWERTQNETDKDRDNIKSQVDVIVKTARV